MCTGFYFYFADQRPASLTAAAVAGQIYAVVFVEQKEPGQVE